MRGEGRGTAGGEGRGKGNGARGGEREGCGPRVGGALWLAAPGDVANRHLPASLTALHCSGESSFNAQRIGKTSIRRGGGRTYDLLRLIQSVFVDIQC